MPRQRGPGDARSRWLCRLGLALTLVSAGSVPSPAQWDCPSTVAADNPIAPAPEAVARGKELARASCAECHGEHGSGNGPAAAAMTSPPASWRSARFQAQSDACIFWKLSTGSSNGMPPARAMPERDRWLIVAFIRSLGTE